MLEKSTYKETATAVAAPAAATATAVDRTDDVEKLPVTRVTQAETKAPPEKCTVIGSDVIFKGEVMAGDNIYIHGTLEGSIARHTKNVVVGEQGRVKALMHANAIRILGQVDGDIYGDEIVELMSGARVNGNIFCACIRIEKGAKFNGTLTMS